MPRRFYVLVTLATLLGAGLRLWQLAEVPPGLHYDLAATALLGNDVAFHGYRPIFITAYTGHEVLFYYWLALWFRLVGSSIFTLRLAAAMLGILAIPAAFFAVREALSSEARGFVPAAFAAAFLSFAFFHVAFSRFGFRVISEPLVQALALGFLFRGLRPAPRATGSTPLRRLFTPGHRSNLALSGFFTGLAAYTYLAARLFPIPLAVFWLALLIGSFRRPAFRFYLSSFIIFSLAALLTFAPLGLYFWQHPEDFVNRASQVASKAGETDLLLQGLRRAVEMIFVDGEPYDRYNIPGRPLFGPALGFFFVVGLGLTLRNLLRPPAHLHTYTPTHLHTYTPTHLHTLSTELLLLAWLPAMLLPTAVSVNDIFPSNIRAFGLIPLLFVFPARGLVASFRWLQHRLNSPLIPHAYPLSLLCLVALAGGVYLTGRDYFVTWARLPNQGLNNDADLTAIAAYLNAQDLTETDVFVSAIHYRHPTLAYLADDFDAIRWLFGGTSLAVPANRPALYVFARSAPLPEAWLAGWEAHLVAAPLGQDNVPDFRAYRFAAGETPPLPEFTPAAANFGHAAQLTGYRVTPGEKQLTVDLRWLILNPIEPADMIPYLRLYDAWGTVWSQSGGFHYPSEQWREGEVLLTRVSVPLPAGLPPGDYGLKAGFYSEAWQTGLPHLDAAGGYAGERAWLSQVRLPGGPAVTAAQFRAGHAMAAPARATGFDGDLRLLGYALPRASVRQGERLPFTLFWQARAPLAANALALQLGGQSLYLGPPVRGTFPFSSWAADQLLTDRYALKVPADFPAGAAELKVSVSGYGEAVLAVVEVVGVERAFSPPDSLAELHHTFGGEIALYGYQLEPGQDTRLILHWASLRAAESDYAVFVHVLDMDGQIVTQADAQPRGGAYPTSLWVPGEFVADTHAFRLPPGRYALALGLYLPETGARLPIADAAGNPAGDALRLPAFDVP